MFNGLSRRYVPKDDDGDKLPPEHALVQIKGREKLEDCKTALAELLDVTATRDWTNCAARADIAVSGKVLVKDAPVTYLLWLEKQVTDIQNDIRKLPVLDSSEVWKWSDETGTYVTDPTETVRTKKIPRNHVLSEATKEHPAQVQVFTEDVVVGNWSTIKQSGAFPAQEITNMLERCADLLKAIKFAREEANGTEAKEIKPGGAVLAYIYG